MTHQKIYHACVPADHVVGATTAHVTVSGDGTKTEGCEQRDEHANGKHSEGCDDSRFARCPTQSHEHDCSHDVEAAWNEATVQSSKLILHCLLRGWFVLNALHVRLLMVKGQMIFVILAREVHERSSFFHGAVAIHVRADGRNESKRVLAIDVLHYVNL